MPGALCLSASHRCEGLPLVGVGMNRAGTLQGGMEGTAPKQQQQQCFVVPDGHIHTAVELLLCPLVLSQTTAVHAQRPKLRW